MYVEHVELFFAGMSSLMMITTVIVQLFLLKPVYSVLILVGVRLNLQACRNVG